MRAPLRAVLVLLVAGLLLGTAPLQALPEAGVLDGRVLVVREEQVVLFEAGGSRVLFAPAVADRVADPAWSPDGASFAFQHVTRRRDITAETPVVERLAVADIVVADADGSNPRVAVAHDGPGTLLEGPSWSPDGGALYYSAYTATYRGNAFVGETLEVRRTDLASGATATLATRGMWPDASTDGAWVVYVSRVDGQESLRLMRPDGSQNRELVAPGEFQALVTPRLSPDGASVAVSAVRFGAAEAPPAPTGALDALARLIGPSVASAHGVPWDVWVVPIDGSAPRRASWIGEDTPVPQWSRDGARILIHGEYGLNLVDPATGKNRVITTEGNYSGMDWYSGS